MNIAILHMPVYLLMNLLLLYSLHRFDTAFFVYRRKTTAPALAAWFLCMGLAYLKFHISVLNASVFILGVLGVTWMYEGENGYKAVAAAFFSVLGVMSELGTGYILALLRRISLNELLGRREGEILIIVISKLLLFIMVQVAAAVCRKRQGDERGAIYWGMIFLIPAGSMYVAYILLCFSRASASGNVNGRVLVCLTALTALNTAVFWINNRLLEREASALENRKLKEEAEYYALQYSRREQQEEQIRSLKHDLRHLLLGAYEALAEGRYQEAEQIIGKPAGWFADLEKCVDSGNLALDAILNYYIACAEKNKAELRHEVRVPAGLRIDGGDLWVLLGNALDNAMEAVLKLKPQKQRWVEVIAFYVKNCLHIVIKNPFEGERVRHGAGYATTKENTGEHGRGLKSMRRISEKYGGSLEVRQAEGVFVTDILIFPEEE